MKPIFRESFLNKYFSAEELAKWDSEGTERQMINTCESSNKLALVYDFKFDGFLTIISVIATAISYFTFYYLDINWPIFLLGGLLALCFIAVYMLRDKRTEYHKAVKSIEQVDLRHMIQTTSYNLDSVKAKYLWALIILVVFLFLCAICGLAFFRPFHLILTISAFFIAVALSLLFYFKDYTKVKKLRNDFESEVKTKISQLGQLN